MMKRIIRTVLPRQRQSARLIIPVLSLASVFFSCSVQAAVTMTCTLNQGVATNFNISSAAISVGPDVPVGTVLYQGKTNNNQGSHRAISCPYPGKSTDTYSFIQDQGYTIDNTLLDAGAKIYKTNVPGIGVQYIMPIGGDETVRKPVSTGWLGINYKRTWPGNMYYYNNTDLGSNYFYEIQFRLIKTGAVTPGTLDGSSLGKITTHTKFAGTSGGTLAVVYSPSEFVIGTFGFTGSLAITVPSCTTPAVTNVDLGTFTTTQLNTDKSTPWKDAAIVLTGCPKFNGAPTGVAQEWRSDWGNGNGVRTVTAPNVANKFGITVNGIQGNLDTVNGVIATNSTAAGAAQGVAVQLAWGTAASNKPMKLGGEYSEDLPTDGTASIRLPLLARLTTWGTSKVKAGDVEARATYLINYK